MRFLFFSLVILLFGGCASSTKQTDMFFSQPTSLPSKALIENVPFIVQTDGHCGPATLTMAMNWSGKNVSVEQIAPQIYTPGANGSFQTDMISASRRQGMFAVKIDGLESLLAEVAAGHPVIVFENLSVSWYPQWHYALVFGYDLQERKVVMHSGLEESKHWNMKTFERSWKLGDYWGLVVLPPGKLSATASELTQSSSAAGLEAIGKLDEAYLSYRAILARWPNSLSAHIGLGNIEFARGEAGKSALTLKAATQFHPESAPVWHNLAIAQGASRQKRAARLSAQKAYSLANSEQKAQYQQSLREWLAP